jgi:hypothetical protein
MKRAGFRNSIAYYGESQPTVSNNMFSYYDSDNFNQPVYAPVNAEINSGLVVGGPVIQPNYVPVNPNISGALVLNFPVINDIDPVLKPVMNVLPVNVIANNDNISVAYKEPGVINSEVLSDTKAVTPSEKAVTVIDKLIAAVEKAVSPEKAATPTAGPKTSDSKFPVYVGLGIACGLLLVLLLKK